MPGTPKSARRRPKHPFASNLRKVITDRGLSQKAVAELAGVRASVINSWLSGAVPADPLAVLRLCRALEADFQWLMTGEFNGFSPRDLRVEDICQVEDEPALSGLFRIEAKRMREKR